MAAIRPPYTATFNDYVRRELGYKTDLHVPHPRRRHRRPWDWGSAGDGFADTSEALRSAFAKNPHMQLFVASGYYDLATPYFATEYTLAPHGPRPRASARASRTGDYEAGPHDVHPRGRARPGSSRTWPRSCEAALEPLTPPE